MSQWFEGASFWSGLSDVLFPESRWEAAVGEVAEVLDLGGLSNRPAPLDVLDLGCGPGRHALEFARRGHRVAGVDLMPDHLSEAARRASEEGLEAEWVQGDLREFEREGAFDLALSLFTSFGYDEDPEGDRRILRNVRRSLRSGGSLVLEMTGKEVLASRFQVRAWHPLGSDEHLLEERSVDPGWGGVESRWTHVRPDGQTAHRMWVRLYSGSEIVTELLRAGFGSAELYGSLRGTPYDHTAERLVVCATA